MLDELPIHFKQEQISQLTALCTKIPDSSSLLYSIQPPQDPPINFQRASVDIVLVIDVSGSMFMEAPLLDAQDSSESAGLSILDLVKHAALTILETLNQGDRLALVTFSDNAQVSNFHFKGGPR